MPDANSMDLPGLNWLSALLTWLERNAKRVILAAIIFQVAVLAAMIVKPARTLATGQTVLLRVVPVDPRDLFKGDYVILGYEFSLLPGEVLPNFNFDNQESRTVYVTLEPEADGLHWKAASYSLERPQNGLYLEGNTTGWRRLEFGIEEFYVQEGTGHAYEDAVREKKLSAEVVVDDDGHAVVSRLVIEE